MCPLEERRPTVPTTNGATVVDPPAPDPFDPKNLVMRQDFAAASGVKKLITMVPVRKPNRYEFVRAHDDSGYELTTFALVFKEDREETFLVDRALWTDLAGELRPIALFTTINRQNVLSLWPVKLPGADGRIDTWNASAMDAVTRAKKQWVRIAANMSLGGYELYEATGELSPPQWPDLTMREILKIAFRDRFISDVDHVVLKKLRGEA
jgi:hypothetical protein